MLKIGEHSKNREDILKELRERILNAGYDIIYLRPQNLSYLSQEDYGQISAFLAENGIRFYFGFNFSRKTRMWTASLTRKLSEGFGKPAGNIS